jgi:uncharacterized protein YqgC (DUF456 family)
VVVGMVVSTAVCHFGFSIRLRKFYCSGAGGFMFIFFGMNSVGSVSDASRSVEICSFLIVGVVSVLSFLYDSIAAVLFCFRFGGLGLFGAKGTF